MNDEPILGTSTKPKPSIVSDPRGSDAPATRGSRSPTLASVTAERARPDEPPRIATTAPELETTMLPVVVDVPARVEVRAPDEASETTGASDDAPEMVCSCAPEDATVRAGRLTAHEPNWSADRCERKSAASDRRGAHDITPTEPRGRHGLDARDDRDRRDA